MATHASATIDNFKTMTETPLPLLNTTGASGHNDNIPFDHACLSMAHMLAQVYNSLFRGLNASYNQMPGILDTFSTSSTATRQFMLFNRYLVNTLAVQVEVVDRMVLFDKFKQASTTGRAYPKNLAAIGNNLKWSHYLEMIQVTANDDFNIYDLRRLQDMIKTLGPALRSYVDELMKWILELPRDLSSDDCKTIMSDTYAHAKLLFSSKKHWPILLCCHDMSFAIDGKTGPFLDLSRWKLQYFRLVKTHGNGGVWKYAPFDACGRRRKLLSHLQESRSITRTHTPEEALKDPEPVKI